MRRLLVTGASGLVGSIVVRQAAADWEVTGTFRNHPADIAGAAMLPCSLENAEETVRLIGRVQPDVIIHTAAMTDVDACQRCPELASRINHEASQIIAAEAGRIGARLVYLSSDQVFDGKKGYYTETDSAVPVNHYGRTKLAGEQAVSGFSGSHVIVRVALVYGAPLQTGNSFTETLIGRLEKGETAALFDDQFRSPVWVENLAAALLELARADYSGVLHLGGPERIDRYHFGKLLAHAMEFPDHLIQPVASQALHFSAPRPCDVSLDTGLAEKLLKTRQLAPAEGLLKMAALKKEYQ